MPGVPFQKLKTFISALNAKPMAKPIAMIFPPCNAASSLIIFALSCDASRDSFDAPAFKTSAQAVPSGYFKNPCWSLIKARRSGIIIKIPKSPPITATNITRVKSRSKPRIIIAGIVTPMPNAIDSPALPAVCITLASKMVASRTPIFDSRRNSVIAITATGIEAETVSPTFNTRYSDDAPKTIPSNVPTISGNGVSSRNVDESGIYGRKFSRKGFFTSKASRFFFVWGKYFELNSALNLHRIAQTSKAVIGFEFEAQGFRFKVQGFLHWSLDFNFTIVNNGQGFSNLKPKT